MNVTAKTFPRAYSVPDVAKIWGVSKSTVYTLISEGRLSHIKVGTCIRVRPDHIEAYEKQCEVIASND